MKNTEKTACQAREIAPQSESDTEALQRSTDVTIQRRNGSTVQRSVPQRQLDLGFRAGPRPRQQMLRSRAKYWFDQMRRVVDAAVEWKPAPLPRPEQGMLDLTRETEVTLAK